MAEHDSERGYEEDEFVLSEINPDWTAEDILNQRSIFYLKDLENGLKLNIRLVKKRAYIIAKQGLNSWEVMGVNKMWTHWIVRMTRFSHYYRKHFEPKYQMPGFNWDANILLQQKGDFQLTTVCDYLPFSTSQLRYRAKKNPRAREEYGIWKDEVLNVYLVRMPVFSTWIIKVWQGDFRK